MFHQYADIVNFCECKTNRDDTTCYEAYRYAFNHSDARALKLLVRANVWRPDWLDDQFLFEQFGTRSVADMMGRMSYEALKDRFEKSCEMMEAVQEGDLDKLESLKDVIKPWPELYNLVLGVESRSHVVEWLMGQGCPPSTRMKQLMRRQTVR